MPENAFIGFDSPVPPSAVPAAKAPRWRRVPASPEQARYQTKASWHHMQKAVERQASPASAIAPMAARSPRPEPSAWGA